MATLKRSPYVCHVLVCTNDREGLRKSCGDDGVAAGVRAALKELIAARGWQGRVRVSASGCLGLCTEGPNVLIYPQRIWLSAVGLDDLELIASTITEALSEEVREP